MNNFISIFLDVSIKSFVILAFVFFVLPALKRLSAATRHLVWMFTMISLLALPVLSIALPSLNLKILPDNKVSKTVSKLVKRPVLAVTKPEITDIKAEKVKKELKKPGKSVFESKSVFRTKKTTFAITPARIGVPYNTTGIVHFLNMVELNIAKEMFFTAKPIDAVKAENLGILNHLIDADELEDFTYKMAADIASNSPLSIAVIKEQLNIMGAAKPINSEFYEKIDELRQKAYNSNDYQEGLQAFYDKRKPKFTGVLLQPFIYCGFGKSYFTWNKINCSSCFMLRVSRGSHKPHHLFKTVPLFHPAFDNSFLEVC